MTLYIPNKCPRNLKNCKPLANIVSECKETFICCGHNSVKSRRTKQDRFRHCFVSVTTDTMFDYDEHDMADTLSVFAQALSVDFHMQANARAVSSKPQMTPPPQGSEEQKGNGDG